MTGAAPRAQVAILCGGRGTRLGALTANLPKPLLPVGDLPFLDHLLMEVARSGFRDILLLAHFESEAVYRFAESSVARRMFDLNLTLSVEPDLAGTGGAVHHARNLLADEFIIMNGDTWLGLDYHALLERRAGAGAIAAIGLREVSEPDRFNVVDLDGSMITRFRRDRAGVGVGYINGGVAACTRELLGYLKAQGSLEDDVWPVLASEGRLAGLPTDGYFLDIGVPEAFERAQTEIPAQQRRSAAFLNRDCGVNPAAGPGGKAVRFDGGQPDELMCKPV
jgi:D-glycero-D-manno-heptose 1,7-bisphosphate phosphatase